MTAAYSPEALLTQTICVIAGIAVFLVLSLLLQGPEVHGVPALAGGRVYLPAADFLGGAGLPDFRGQTGSPLPHGFQPRTL